MSHTALRAHDRTQFAFMRGTLAYVITTDLDKILKMVDDPKSGFFHWTIVSRNPYTTDAWSIDPDLNYT